MSHGGKRRICLAPSLISKRSEPWNIDFCAEVFSSLFEFVIIEQISGIQIASFSTELIEDKKYHWGKKLKFKLKLLLFKVFVLVIISSLKGCGQEETTEVKAAPSKTRKGSNEMDSLAALSGSSAGTPGDRCQRAVGFNDYAAAGSRPKIGPGHY